MSVSRWMNYLKEKLAVAMIENESLRHELYGSDEGGKT